jgi:hypothetical protein
MRAAMALTVGTILLTAVAVAGAEGQQQAPPISFTPASALAVSCADLAKKPQPVGVQNETGQGITVTLRLNMLHDKKGMAHDPAKVCGGVKLPPSLVLRPADAQPAPLSTGLPPKNGKAVYSGTIAAYVGQGVVVRRQLVLSEGPVTADAVPRTDSVTMTIYKGRPWGTNRIDVPVDVPQGKPLALASGDVLGGVAGRGQSAEVTYAGTKKLSSKTTDVKLQVGSLGVGSYDASADLLPADDAKGAVALKLTVKDWWVWPALAVLLGILLGLPIQRWLSVTVPKNRLKGEVDATSARYDDAKKTLRDAAGTKPWASYDINDLPGRQAALRTAIDSAASDAGLAIDQKVIDTLEAAIKALEDDVDRFGSVPMKMSALEQALDTLKSRLPSPLPQRTGDIAAEDEPALAREGRKCLNGTTMSMDDLKTRLAEVDAWTAAATELYLLARDTSQRCVDLQKLSADADADQKQMLEPILDRLAALWFELWRVDTPQALTDVEAHKELHGIFDAIAAAHVGIYPRRVPPGRPSLMAAEAAHARTLGMVADQEPQPDAASQAIESDANALKSARLAGIAVVVVSLLVALVTAMSALYVGQAFGTVWDYVTAVAWGLGTQAVLATLTAAIGGLAGLHAVGRRLRLS